MRSILALVAGIVLAGLQLAAAADMPPPPVKAPPAPVLAPVPLAATLAMGALPIGQFGSKEQQQAWLPKVAKGPTILSARSTWPGLTTGVPRIRTDEGAGRVVCPVVSEHPRSCRKRRMASPL